MSAKVVACPLATILTSIAKNTCQRERRRRPLLWTKTLADNTTATKRALCQSLGKRVDPPQPAGRLDLDALAATGRRWRPWIEHVFRDRVTKGATEGINTTIKLLERVAYGLSVKSVPISHPSLLSFFASACTFWLGRETIQAERRMDINSDTRKETCLC